MLNFNVSEKIMLLDCIRLKKRELATAIKDLAIHNDDYQNDRAIEILNETLEEVIALENKLF